MAGVLQHLRSSTLDKRPNPASMVDGQVAINYASGAPGMFFKDSNGDLVKVGPVHVGSGAPNAVPASGGTAGNSVGEQWLDTSGSTYVFKIWDGSAWRSEAGEFVNVTGDTMTGALGIIAGSQGSPSLFISGDADTGLYSPGANQVAISTNGTGRLFVDASGKVGVGTASPVVALQAGDGSASLNWIRVYGTTSDIFLGQNTSDVHLGQVNSAKLLSTNASHPFGIGTTTSQSLIIGTNNTERLRITSDGKLGLGTSAPWTNIEIRGSNVADGVASRTFATPPSNLHIGVNGFAQNTGGSISFGSEPDGVNDYCAYGAIAARRDSALSYEYSGYLTFSTSNGANLNEQMRLTSAGRLGIGTTSPGALLEVVGTGSEVARFRGNGANGGWITWNSGGTNYGYIGPAALLASGTSTQFTIRSENELLFTSGGGTERARIDSSGRLLVGTSSQSGGSLLQVNDDRIRIASSKTPASASDTGTAGEICWDASYIYVCTATNTWKRTAISTW